MSQIVATAPLRLEHVRFPFAPTTGATMHGDWFAEAHREGRSVVVSVTAADPRQALDQLTLSDDPMDFLFKDFVRSLTGLEVATLF